MRDSTLLKKRLFDIVFSFISLIYFIPILIAVGFLIKIYDGGPVFYRSIRIGLHGKPFVLLKFRTMVVDADKIGGSSTADDDPRITKIGKVLRKYKLDELPQLANVLKGDMSIVGPRPEVKYYVDMFTEEEKAILNVQPGITDWASLWNSDEGEVLKGSPDPDQDYLEKIRPEKIRLQLKYVKERSFLTDMQIIYQTMRVIFRRDKHLGVNS